MFQNQKDPRLIACEGVRERKNSRMVTSFSLGNLGDGDGIATIDGEFNSFKDEQPECGGWTETGKRVR